MTIATADYSSHSVMTRTESPIIKGIVNKYKDKSIGLDTLDTIVNDVNKLKKVGKIERPYPYLRTVGEIVAEGLYEGFDHDVTLVLISIFRELGVTASYGFYFKQPEEQQPIPKSVAIVDLSGKGRWVIFNTEPKKYVEFTERIEDYVFSGEGADPKSMGISDLNTLLRWQEEKRDDYLQRMSSSLYMGVYGKLGELIVRNGVLQLPSEIMKTFSVRNPRSNRLYLSIGRFITSSDKVMRYVMSLDERAASTRSWIERPRDTTEANTVEIVDGSIQIPQTFYDIFSKVKSPTITETPLQLENVVIEAERSGEFFKIWGQRQYFGYFRVTYEGRELMKMFSFADRRLWGRDFLSMDDKTRLNWGYELMALLLTRNGIIRKDEAKTKTLKELKEIYSGAPEIALYFKFEGQDKAGNIILTFLDSTPFDGELGFCELTLGHDSRTHLGQGIFDPRLISDARKFYNRSLDVEFSGLDDRTFQLVLKKPK